MSQKKLPTFKMKKLWKDVRTGVTEVNDTKSRAKFFHLAFLLVFIGIFRLLGINVDIRLHIGTKL